MLLALALPLPAFAQRRAAVKVAGEEQSGVERKIAAASDVTVSLCISSGDVIVRGWDKAEVHVRSEQAERVELKESKSAKPGKVIEALISNYAEDKNAARPFICDAISDVELDVPRGASVHIKVHEGDVDISNVAEARVESLNGDVDLRRVSRAVDVSCLSGDISLSDSKGRARLRSVSGSVEASNIERVAAEDELQALSTSGDLTLEHIGQLSVKGATTSGNVYLSGALVNRGSYEFSTHSGDVTMELPENASFKVNARVVLSGEIITDFPVRVGNGPDGVKELEEISVAGPPHGKVLVKIPKPPTQTNLVGIVGKGDAELKLTSFSGTVYLKKE